MLTTINQLNRYNKKCENRQTSGTKHGDTDSKLNKGRGTLCLYYVIMTMGLFEFIHVEINLPKQVDIVGSETSTDTISYPLFVPRIRKGTHLKESVFPEAEG